MTASRSSGLRWGWAGAIAALLLAADVSLAQTPLRGAPLAFRPSTTIPFPRPGVQVFGPALGPNGSPPGPQIGNRFVSQLMPGKPEQPLLNNGSLQVSINPAPNLPNSIPFTYIAALPLGDRLGKNGVVYDPELLANIGFSPTLPLVGANATFGPYLFPSIPPIQNNILNFGGDFFNRQRAMNDALMAAAAQQMAAMNGPAGGPMAFGPLGNGGGFGAGFNPPPIFNDNDNAKDKDNDKDRKDRKKDKREKQDE
jgi:hypothetical protein